MFESKGTAFTGTFACAYYPAANATSYADGTGTLDAAKGNLDLTFKNVFGLVQLNFIGTETVTKIDLVSTKSLSGTATIATDGSCATTITKGNKQVSLTFETPVTLTGTATAFSIAVPADSTVSKVYVTTTSSTSPASTSLLYRAKDITPSRSHIASLNSATLSAAGFEPITYSEASNTAPVVAGGTVWAPVTVDTSRRREIAERHSDIHTASSTSGDGNMVRDTIPPTQHIPPESR